MSVSYGDEDIMVLIVDRRTLTNPRKVGYGGLICKHDESFQLGFFGSVGISNIIHAEIQTLLTSIKLCWDAGYRKLVCYTDFLHVVQLVMKETTTRLLHCANLL